MSEWEILVSEDAKNWKSVDYQVNNDNGISSYDIGTQTPENDDMDPIIVDDCTIVGKAYALYRPILKYKFPRSA